MSSAENTEPTVAPPAAPSDDAPAANRWARLDPRRLWADPRGQLLVAAVLFLAYWAWLSRPLLWNLDTDLWGAIGDQTGFLSLYREVVEQQHGVPFLPGTARDLAAPEGLEYNWVTLFGQLPASVTMSGLTAVFGALVAVSIYATIGIVGTAVATFLLARRLTGAPGPSLLAGVAFGFMPLVIIKSTGHLDFSHGWVLVLALWRWIELIEKPDRRNAWLAGAATLLAVSWTSYFALLAAAIAVPAALVVLGRAGRPGFRTTFPLVVRAGILSIGWVVMVYVLAAAFPGSAVTPTRTLDELTVYAARPLDYLIPAGNNPLFGDQANRWRESHLHGSNLSESLLYLGISVLVLAAVGFVAAVRQQRERVLVLFLVALAAVAFWASAPPYVHLLGINVPTPSRFVFEVQPGFRVYSRFALVVALATALLAARGLLALTRTTSRPVLRLVIVVATVAVVAADLRFEIPPNRIGELQSYRKLAGEPAGLAAELPLMPAAEDLNQASFYQQIYDKPLLNGYVEGSIQEARSRAVGDLGKPASIRALRALGVRYLLVRQDTKLINWPDPGTPPARDATLLASEPAMRLYRLKPGPGEIGTWFPKLLAGEAKVGDESFAWADGDESELEVRSTCRTCRGTATITLVSFGATPREVKITGPGTSVTAKVAEGPTEVRVPFRLVDGEADLEVRSTPGPVPARSIDPTSRDPRSLGLGLSTVPRLTIEKE